MEIVLLMTYKLCKHCGKKFKPERETQLDCSELCLALRFDTLVRKTRKIASIYAKTMGYRSMSEVRYAARLKGKQVPFEYEEDRFVYQYKPQKYTPDFKLKDKKGHTIYLEFKGKLDAATRKKMLAIKSSNPKVDLRLVFEKPCNRIYKGSNTRYFEWAVKHGFKWYSAKDVNKLKSDLMGR